MTSDNARTILTVVGARPQFIKAAAVCRALAPAIDAGGCRHVLVHTGQHYDANMSEVFFEQLEIPRPDVNLGIGGGSHGKMTGEMLAAIEQELLDHRPDWLVIYGDTNSTLAAAVAAAKLHVPVAHVEAGLRSYNRRMPEEINRVLSDHVSRLLLCPTEAAVTNLDAEGIRDGVEMVGDVMYDVAMYYKPSAAEKSVLPSMEIAPGEYFLATCHRQENTDDPRRLEAILRALDRSGGDGCPVVLPIHPRTRARIQQHKLAVPASIRMLEPVGYLEMLDLERNARAILTDSGGVQKEAYFYNVPCVTMRPETEWVETVSAGWNTLVDADEQVIVNAAARVDEVRRLPHPDLYGDGHAAEKIVELLLA
ncbi:MAG: non-hydrolyzing UDP-N-acetylglucosamine 2-epimerase [Phycisphaerae bacterium]